MKKIFVKLIYFLIPVLILFVSIHLFYFNTSLNRNISYEFKQGILEKNKESKKIVLIGGSNCRYSYSSEILAQNFPDYKIVNSAIMAPYGLKFYLNFITPYLKEGDIVILSPEYLFLTTKNGIYGNEELVLLANSYPNFYRKVFSDFSSSKHFLSLSFRHLLSMINRIKLSRKVTLEQKIDQVYGSHDKTGQVSSYPKTSVYSNYKIFVNEYISNESVNILNEKISEYSAMGVKFYINFPSAEGSRYIQTIQDKEYCENIIEKVPNAVLLNKPSESVYDFKLFYNSPYHLNEKGKIIHTQRMVENLKSRIK